MTMDKKRLQACRRCLIILWRRWAIVYAVLIPFALTAQISPIADTATVLTTPGARYAASGLHQFFFGSNYRDLWATPIKVQALNLRTFAGGLTPVRSHSGSQTKSLRFNGADGQSYQFRGIDKDPTAKFPPEIQKTIAARILQDGVSSSHPFGGLVAAALLQAAGILHVEPHLTVLPDDPALGEYRVEFAGMLGGIEERPNESDEESESFAGASKVIGPSRLFERMNKSPKDRVDARAFLAARLMDIFMGDRDRHRDNWRWARLGDNSTAAWQPISRDHDEAFVKLQGLLPGLAKFYFLQLVMFGPEYPNIVRLHWHGREVDRRFLVDLEKPAWDSTATALQARLTDAVIDEAVRHLPAEIYAKNGAELSQALKRRRDHLAEEADVFYRFLAQQVEIHATDAAEVAELTRVDDHHLDVVIAERSAGARPYFRRRFDDRETKEIRLRMFGGDDRVVVRGAGNPKITLRIMGGEGNDALIDSTRAGGVRFYDAAGNNQVMALRGTRLNTRPYHEWVGSDVNRYPPREWGEWWRPLPWVTAGADLGLFIGGGFSRIGYGFRKSPYASYISLRGGYATAARTARVEFNGDFRHENSSVRTKVHARASGIEILRYYGLGNDTKASGSSNFYKVRQQQYTFEPAIVMPVDSNLTVALGPTATFSHIGANEGRFINTISDTLYGARDFGQAGGLLSIQLDTRNRPAAPSKGFLLAASGRAFPKLWDVKSAFGTVEAQAATYLTAPVVLQPTLALRVGGKKIWGTYPFHESAFIGGASTLRGWLSQRFAGDAALYGNAELRLFLTKFFFVLPGDFGVFGLADAGRVYVNGDSPGGWHSAAGGGIWFAFLDRANTVAIGVANSVEHTAVYIRAGFAF
jgi:Omp85 superfamily domain